MEHDSGIKFLVVARLQMLYGRKIFIVVWGGVDEDILSIGRQYNLSLWEDVIVFLRV